MINGERRGEAVFSEERDYLIFVDLLREAVEQAR